MTKYGFAINLDRCIGCRTCTISCKMENHIPDQNERIRVLNSDEQTTYDRPTGTYPALSLIWAPVPCQHCDTPPCVPACPVEGATGKRDDGLVWIDEEKCNGCKACIEACPYGARQYEEETGKVDKCTLCSHRLDAGLGTTICQISCPGRAIVVGDLDASDSPIAEIVASNATTHLLEEEGTHPQVYYWNSFTS